MLPRNVSSALLPLSSVWATFGEEPAAAVLEVVVAVEATADGLETRAVVTKVGPLESQFVFGVLLVPGAPGAKIISTRI